MGSRGTGSPTSPVIWSSLTAFVHRSALGLPSASLTPVGRCFRSTMTPTSAFRGLGLVRPVPLRPFSGETLGSHTFPWIPVLPMTCSQTPAGADVLAFCRRPLLTPSIPTARSPTIRFNFGALYRPSVVATYGFSFPSPFQSKSRFRLVASLYRAGLVTCRAPLRGFCFVVPYISSSST